MFYKSLKIIYNANASIIILIEVSVFSSASLERPITRVKLVANLSD